MLGAIYIGMSGLSAYSRGIQTVSDNVVNLNSPGFKANSAGFRDVYSSGGGGLTFSSPSSEEQFGSGVRFGGGQVDFSQGDLRQSTGDLDLAIQGGGFLILKDDGETYYARTGQFNVDEKGFISLQGTKYHLTVLDQNNNAKALNIDAMRTSSPLASARVKFSDNLSSSSTSASVSNIAVYDSNGGRHVWQVNFAPVSGVPGQWNVTVVDDLGATVGGSTLKFIGSIPDPSQAEITISYAPPNADPMSVVLDFTTGVTSYSAGTTSSLRAADTDGHGVGALTNVSIDDEGRVQLIYTNGETDLVGSVALADFRDPQKLTRVGAGLYQNTSSGQGRLLASGKEGIGVLLSRQLEASNVDLSQQFGDLILIQRGFQASSQVVSVANDMIQQLFGIRGQG